MNFLFHARDALLGMVTGEGFDTVLNATDYRADENQVNQVAVDIQQALTTFRTEYMDEWGGHVDYAGLGQSAIYQYYRSTITPRLQRFNPTLLASRQEQLAFWINLYNALVIDSVITHGVRESVTEGFSGVLGFFRRAAYIVGGQRLSCEDIEHGILRENRGNPYVPGNQFPQDDRRRSWIMTPMDVRIHWALNCASRSCPPIQVYDPASIETQLETAMRSFLDKTTSIDTQQGSVHLSSILNWYGSDFGGHKGVLSLLMQHLPDDERRRWIVGQPSVDLVFTRYDWSLPQL
ncbi:MAG: DUF547 domain-containing protein [Chloroflexaceae bacterium]|nr:DUF547 domain-containing protein [Chloroflexaceae bacterium]